MSVSSNVYWKYFLGTALAKVSTLCHLVRQYLNLFSFFFLVLLYASLSLSLAKTSRITFSSISTPIYGNPNFRAACPALHVPHPMSITTERCISVACLSIKSPHNASGFSDTLAAFCFPVVASLTSKSSFLLNM